MIKRNRGHSTLHNVITLLSLNINCTILSIICNTIIFFFILLLIIINAICVGILETTYFKTEFNNNELMYYDTS